MNKITELIDIKGAAIGGTGSLLLAQFPSPDQISQVGQGLIMVLTIVSQIVHLFKKKKKNQSNEESN